MRSIVAFFKGRPFLAVISYILLFPLAEILFALQLRHYLKELSAGPHRTRDHETDLHDVLRFWQLLSTSEPERIQSLVEGWFLGEGDIRRGNVTDLIAWTLYDERVESLNSEQKQLVEDLLHEVEGRIGKRFPAGKSEGLTCMRHTLDGLDVVYKPLGFYLFLIGAQWFAALVLRSCSFELLECDGLSYFSRPPRLQRGGSTRTTDGAAAEPLVIMHGVGGLPLYVGCILQLGKAVPDAHLLVPLFTQCQIRLPLLDEAPLPTRRMTSALKDMVRRHSALPATFVAHSMGTAFLAALLRAHPAVASSAVFADPICFLLYRCPVLYNFLYRRPRLLQSLLRPLEWPKLFLRKVISDEPSMQVCFRKDFWWSQYWLHPTMLTCDAAVLLSSHDMIVPSEQVYSYLLEHMAKRAGAPSAESPPPRLRVDMHTRFDHGLLMALPHLKNGIVESVLWARNAQPELADSERSGGCDGLVASAAHSKQT